MRSCSGCSAAKTLPLLLAALLCLACGVPPPARGPIVLLTVGGLRADVLGVAGHEPGSAPRLDELAATASWSGAAVTASSDPLAALTSLLCGVSPWQHQVLAADRVHRRLPTLARALRSGGYRSRAYVPAGLHELLGEDFDQVAGPLAGKAAAAVVADLGDSELVWLHFSDAEVTTGRWRRAAGKPAFARHRLLAYADPEADLPEALRIELREAYDDGVRRLDGILGEILDAFTRSPARERATLVLTGSHGVELGEHGRILAGENLGRAAIEVPLLVRWPERFGAAAEPRGGRVAQTRLWATLAEIAGVAPAPVHPPSLFRAPAPSGAAILSELYAGNGVNRFSLLDGDLQLHWVTRFAPSEPEYYLARRVEAGGRARLLLEPPRRIAARLGVAFERTLPLSGPPGTRPELELERWTRHGVERLDDPAVAGEMAARLERRWMRFVPRESTPERERAEPHSGRLF